MNTVPDSEISLGLLVTPGFLAALALLLVNDWYLKAAYGNWLTGKLSDFAGVLALALLLTALRPTRRTAVHVATGIAFIAWKSPLATPLIEAWNGIGIFAVDRVLDYTDWMALAVLPFSWRYARVARPIGKLILLRPIIAVVASAAFIATSYAPIRTPDGSRFEISLSRPAALAAIDSLAEADSAFRVWPEEGARDTLTISFDIRTGVRVELRDLDSNRVEVTIIDVFTPRHSDGPPASEIRRRFVVAVVEPLRSLAQDRPPTD